MKTQPVTQVDAFTDRAFAGNRPRCACWTTTWMKR